MNRKIIGLALCSMLLAPCSSVQAQQTGKIPRIGYLDNSTASGIAVLLEAFRQELSKLGWIEGKNITIEYRFAERKPERLPELAADLVRLKVDLIVASGGPSAVSGEESNYYHPHRDDERCGPCGCRFGCQSGAAGRQCHRSFGLAPELTTKRLEVLKDAVPKLARVGLLLRRRTSDKLNSN